MPKGLSDLVYAEECYAIVGGCFAVYKEKGCGFLEEVYQECCEIEFEYLKIPAVAKPHVSLSFRAKALRKSYEPDFVCFDKIIVELKAVSALAVEHRAQVINYLNATGYRLGLLINFGSHPRLEWERFVHSGDGAEAPGAGAISL